MFGIGMGPDSNEQNAFGALKSGAGFATGLGEKNLTTASNFMGDIASGDASRITQALAPQISAAKQSAQQNTATAAQFGTRGGGTGAFTASTNDRIHAGITNLIGSLTGGAVSGLGTMGGNLMGQGLTGTQAEFGEANTLHQQRMAQINDIFSSAAKLAGPVAGAVGAGFDALSQVPGDFFDKAGNFMGQFSGSPGAN
jgi:hypothetical protein